MGSTRAKDQGRRLPRGGLSAHAALAREIGRRIVRGEFAVGTVLPNESMWTEEYGVSRSVVREALKMLAAKGLLASRPKVGSRVEDRSRWNLLDRDVLGWYAETPGGPHVLVALQEFRRIFEPEAAALAALRRTPAQLEKIAAACAAMGSAPTMKDRAVADVEFHMAILEASANELLLPLGVLIESALDSLFVSINRAAGELYHAQELHEAIVAAIRLQRPAAARKAVRALMDNSDALVRSLENQGGPLAGAETGVD